MAIWGNHLDEISVHIDGPKTDWANLGCIRPHTITPIGSNNSDLCVARALIDLYEAYPRKFSTETATIFASRRNGNAINSGHLISLTKSEVFKKGANHSAFSLNLSRDGWAPPFTMKPRTLNSYPAYGGGRKNRYRHICGKVTKCRRR